MKNLVYKPKNGGGSITTISKDCKTPLLRIKFCNLIKAYYYQSSPTIPRYSISCVIDPDKPEEGTFLSTIQSIEKNEGLSTIIKNELVRVGQENVPTKNFVIKFQGSKDKIPVYVVNSDGSAQFITLEGDLEAGEKVIVVYDILRYTVKKGGKDPEYGLSFRPTAVFLYPSDQTNVSEE